MGNVGKVKVYSFEWIDENGKYAGWNDVTTTKGIVDARKSAKAKESPSRDFEYGIILADGTSGRATERFTGLFVNWKTFKQISVEQHFDDHQQAYLNSI